MRMIYLGEQDTRTILDLDRVLDIIEQVARATPSGGVKFSEPGTSVLMLDDPKCRYRIKACALLDLPVVGIRIIGYPSAGGDGTSSTRFVMLSDPATGEPLALIDDHWNYTLRTAASAVVGLGHLVADGTLTLASVGAGNLARAMVMLLAHGGRLARVQVSSRRAESREAFAAWVRGEYGIAAEACGDVQSALAGADLVVTSTNANRRLVEPQWVVPGTTLCTLGRFELAPEIYAAADKLVVDSWQIAKSVPDVKEMVAAGVVSEAGVHAELHDLVLGRKPGRESREETIVFRTDGLVSQDVAIAWVVYQAALERGLGTPLP
jgi:ornithine cyclodeaminase/alanine dehydrogenase-like protein (mu-crystallin family)